MGISFKRDNTKVKKPGHLTKNIFIIYAPRTVTVEPVSCSKTDRGIVLILQKNAKAFVTSRFRGGEIFEVNGETQSLWIEILNKSYNEHKKINKNSVLGFVVIEPEYLSFKHEMTKAKKKKKRKRYYQKRGAPGQKRKRQRGG